MAFAAVANDSLGHALGFAETALISLCLFLLAALAGLGFSAACRHRDLAWTWGLLPICPSVLVASLLVMAGVPFAIGAPLACVLLGLSLGAGAWSAHGELEDRRTGADREIEAGRRRRPLDAARRWVAERRSRSGDLLSADLPIGRNRRGELVCVPRGSAESGAHVLIPGATGAGKSTSLGALLVEYVARSRFGAVVIEAKNDSALKRSAEEAARAGGAPFRLIAPEGSWGYDPLATGTVDERSERLVAAQTWGSEDADFYRQASSPFLRLVLRGLEVAALPPTLRSVAEHCGPDRLENLVNDLDAPMLRRELTSLAAGIHADEKRAIAGLRARLLNLATSEFASSWLDPQRPGVQTIGLGEAIAGREVVYFRLDTDRTGNVGRAIGQMVMLDLGAVASSMMGNGVGTFVAIDEFGAIEAPALDRLYTRGRAAGFSVALGTHSLADLRAAGPAVRERVGATTAAIICHRIGGQEDAEWVAQAIGTVPTWERTTRTNGLGQASGEGTRTRGYRFEVNPSELQRLGQGEVVVARLAEAGSRRSARVAVVPPWRRLPRRTELDQQEGPSRVDRRSTNMSIVMPATLTKDPKLVHQGETIVCEMRVAEMRSVGVQLFIEVAVFGTQAEHCAKYLKKGRHVLVDGRLRLEEWTGKDEVPRRDFSIVADRVTFLPGGSRSEETGPESPTPAQEPEPTPVNSAG